MPIITKAGTPAKGSPTEFTLDKAELLLLISDVYYAESDNWKEVVLNYKSLEGNQSTVVKFNPALTPCVANFAVSARARNQFNIHEIVIKDFDGGTFKIPRSALTAADFDVDMGTPVGPSIDYIDWDLYTFGVHTLGPEGFIQKLGPVLNYELAPRSIADQIAPDTDFNLTFEALDTDIEDGWSVGLAKTSSSLTAADQFVFYVENSALNFNSENMFNLSYIPLNIGTNYINIIRVGGQMSFYLNSNPIHATAYSGFLMPLVRLGGTVRKAYKQ